jgi:hypothetical protein
MLLNKSKNRSLKVDNAGRYEDDYLSFSQELGLCLSLPPLFTNCTPYEEVSLV